MIDVNLDVGTDRQVELALGHLVDGQPRGQIYDANVDDTGQPGGETKHGVCIELLNFYFGHANSLLGVGLEHLLNDVTVGRLVNGQSQPYR